MFTGIIKEQGIIEEIIPFQGGASLKIFSKELLKDALIGDSVAVNGCCLTVTKIENSIYSFDAVIETLNRTNLGSLQPKDLVNLERPLAFNGKLDGHLVQGHVDQTGKIKQKKLLKDNSLLVTIQPPFSILKYCIEKGSITIDGISLTITEVTQETFSVVLIPHTQKETTLTRKGVGQNVNLEADLIAKYIERLTSVHNTATDNTPISFDNNFLDKKPLKTPSSSPRTSIVNKEPVYDT